MSEYTIDVMGIVNIYNNSADSSNMLEKIEKALPSIFDFSYPIWNEEHRRTLEKKIIMHYINREIAFETIGLWKLYLNEALNRIMPFYNEIYKSVDIKFEPYNIHVEEKISINEKNENEYTENDFSKTDRTSNIISNDSSTVTTQSTSANVNSDFPQATLNGLDYAINGQDGKSQINSSNVGQSGSKADNYDTTETDNVHTGKESKEHSHDSTKKGYSGITIAEMAKEYREAIINIDEMVIKDLKHLFMTIY